MQPGAVLAQKYRVERVLGQGGMGIVVQATHMQLGTPVAMKFLLPEVLGNQEVVQRFLREAQAAVRLKSEHVARVIDVGSLETGAPYIVMEFLEGTDLSGFPRNELEGGGLVDLMLQACEGLFDAHNLGIVHRDIKPANLFITRRTDGSPLLKILDFGISKSQTALEGNLTATSAVMGTPAYMSPEQMRSTRDVDGRSDIWALGIVMYELLEGVPPFVAETFTAFAIKVATEPLPPMKRQHPPGLAEVVYRCLEKDRERRFRNVGELASALAPYARTQTQAAVTLQRTGGGMRASTPSAPTIAATPPHGSTFTNASGAVTAPPAARSRWPLFAGIGVVAAAGVAIAIVLAGGHSTPEPAKSDPVAKPDPAPVATPAPTPTPPPPPVVTPDAAVEVVAAPPDAAVTAAAPADAAVPAVAKHHTTVKHTTKPATGSAAPSDDDILGARH